MTRITANTAADLAAFQCVEDHPVKDLSPLYEPHTPLTYREVLATAEVEDIAGYVSADGRTYAFAVTVIYAAEGWGATYGVTPAGEVTLWAD